MYSPEYVLEGDHGGEDILFRRSEKFSSEVLIRAFSGGSIYIFCFSFYDLFTKL